MSATGKVMALDAEGLDLLNESARYPGLVVIEITCTLQQSREWAKLFGQRVTAELAPIEPPAAEEPSAQASLPGVEHD